MLLTCVEVMASLANGELGQRLVPRLGQGLSACSIVNEAPSSVDHAACKDGHVEKVADR
jgi:hypothetical protein